MASTSICKALPRRLQGCSCFRSPSRRFLQTQVSPRGDIISTGSLEVFGVDGVTPSLATKLRVVGSKVAIPKSFQVPPSQTESPPKQPDRTIPVKVDWLHEHENGATNSSLSVTPQTNATPQSATVLQHEDLEISVRVLLENVQLKELLDRSKLAFVPGHYSDEVLEAWRAQRTESSALPISVLAPTSSSEGGPPLALSSSTESHLRSSHHIARDLNLAVYTLKIKEDLALRDTLAVGKEAFQTLFGMTHEVAEKAAVAWLMSDPDWEVHWM